MSVIVPSTRSEQLAHQVDALARQTFDRPWELVVVTAGPPEELEVLLTALGRPCTVLRRSKAGPSAARNVGAREARADLLAFCDDDDEVGEQWLAALVHRLATADAAAGPWELDRNDSSVVAAYGLPTRQEALATVGGWLPFGETSNLAVRRDAFDAVGGFDEEFLTAEDRDLCIRLQLAGYTLAFVPEAVVHRRLRPSTWHVMVQAHRWARGEVLLYRRHRAHGMPPEDGLRAWLRVGRDVPHLLSGTRRAGWLRRLAERTGRLDGSLRYRTRYL